LGRLRAYLVTIIAPRFNHLGGRSLDRSKKI
jgi:hypothetical protein